MLSEQRIRQMIRLANYENGAGKQDLHLVSYYKTDYIRFEILKTILGISLAFFIILFGVGTYNIEYLINNAVSLNYVGVGTAVLVIYILLVVLFCAITVAISAVRYDEAKKRVKKYYNSLNLLVKTYQDEEKEDILL